jgi:hypothetical protein
MRKMAGGRRLDKHYSPNTPPELAGPKIGVTSLVTVSTISSDEQRFGVRTHSLAAPKIAQLTVDAIISGDAAL